MRQVHVFLRLFLAFLIVIGINVASAAQFDEEAVRIAVNRFAEAWNRHDLDAFGALFAVHADFVNVTGQLWRGRKEIQIRHAYTHGTIPREAVPERARVPRGDRGGIRPSHCARRLDDARRHSYCRATARHDDIHAD